MSVFPIVGVGASAGGLEAFTLLLKGLPPDPGMAFVLVQHLAPNQPSSLAEILSRATAMTVREARDEVAIEANHVYVIPPDRSMVIKDGSLRLLPREGGTLHRPIDQFFRSLAEEENDRAIGVVLSGTATDGTLGLEAIKTEGGVTFAQDGTAQHPGMPRSAIESGHVDFVLSPEAMAAELVRVGRHPLAGENDDGAGASGQMDLAPVLRILQGAHGVDFSHYKFNTLYRRVARRMLLRKMDDLAAYVAFLNDAPLEVDALFQDILINVTSFFRDQESYEALATTFFPRLLAGRDPRDPVRLWSLGCSTGQEAYSLAITFVEAAEANQSPASLQVFATDLNEHSIERARAGLFPKDLAQDISPERLRRFFTETPDHYRVNKSIRNVCVFSRHNVLSDPPFSRLDFISCRNLLIYLEPVLQQKVMPTLHYALKPGGFLWLGGSESVGVRRNLFRPEDLKHKVYSKVAGAKASREPFAREPGGQTPPAPTARGARAETVVDLHREVDRLLSTRFAPPGVLVSSSLDILQYRGDTSLYLSPAPGKPSLNLLKMMRESLVVPVRAAVLRAGREGVTVRETGLGVRSDHGHRDVAIEVIPVKAQGTTEPGFLILFTDTTAQTGGSSDPASALSPSQPSTEARLEQELAATRDYLQSLIDQQETTNEALQSANEEAQSANEELQSTNEELETSKEEIESSSEELATINDELNDRNRELNRANNDLVNLVASIQTAIVLVGPDFRIRRFTPLAEALLNLIPADVGRPLADIKLNLDHVPDLAPLLKQVFETSEMREAEVRDKQGRWYSLRLRPYRTLDNTIDGVVVVVIDIDLLKRAHNYTESIVATVREPLLVLNADLRVQSASASFYQTYLVSPEETIGRQLYDLGNGQWDIKELRRVLTEILPRDNQVDDFEVEHHFDRIGTRTVRLNARRLVQIKEHDPLILLAIEDVTESKKQAGALRQLASDLSEADRRKNEFLAMLAHELRNPLAPILNAVEILKVPDVQKDITTPAFAMLTRQVNQMVRLVDDLLDVSRISLGKIELRRERTDLTSIITSIADASRTNMSRLDQKLTVALPGEPIYAFVDSTRFSQVIGNLLNNASKFSPQGRPIWLSLAREDKNAVIRVRDSGMGIAADQIRRIFDLFVQGDTSLERSVSGLGIGLTLVRRLVEAHQGTVDVRSAGLGEGSEFVVRLPFMEGTGIQQDGAARSERLRPTTSRRILVVDDNKDAADSLSILLQLRGHTTHSVGDGQAAVEQAERFAPEIILLDIGLPKLNGYEVCRLIRAQPWGEKIVILACTGWGETAARQASDDAGFTGHLVKPVDLAALEAFLV